MSMRPLSVRTTALFRSGITLLAPTVALFSHAYHPWIGNPADADFFERLAAAVVANPARWAISHLGVAVGSGLVALAFLAVRSYLREADENRWSPLALPFIILGSVFYAMLPAIEFAPLGANRASLDIAALQRALMPWFVPILMTSAVIFAVGVLGFVIAIARSQVLGPASTWLAASGLLALGATRFFPVGVAQLYVGPAAGVVALWPLALTMWKRPLPQPAADRR